MPVTMPAPNTAFRLDRSLSWWDPDLECRLVLSQPANDPELWSKYCDGAARRYRQSGIETTLDSEEVRTGGDTLMYFCAVDGEERVLGGLRAIGPLGSADESHALSEWAGQPAQEAVRRIITDRIPFGLLELKTAWVSDDRARNRSVVRGLARAPLHMMGLLGIQFCMGTAAHALNSWRTSGAVISDIAATPYPDDRYQTRMVWWDQRTFVEHADPEQVTKVHLETTRLIHHLYGASFAGVDAENAS